MRVIALLAMEAGSEAKLVLGQKILLFQVGHDRPVHHFLHDFGEDAQQGHRAVVWTAVRDLFLWIGTTFAVFHKDG